MKTLTEAKYKEIRGLTTAVAIAWLFVGDRIYTTPPSSGISYWQN